MSENQYLEIIDGKIDVVKNLVEQQSKSGMFFDSFTKQVLEKIEGKLDSLTSQETNELITYLSKEIKNSIEERQIVLQERLDGVQGQMNSIQSSLVDSLKSPEIAAIFTKLSDTVLDFSRNLNSQTKYFNSSIEDIQKEISKINVDEKFIEQTKNIRLDIERYKIDVASVVDSINANFSSIKALIEENNKTPEAFTALSSDIDVLQKGLNDILSVATVIEGKQSDFLFAMKDIATNSNVEEIRLNLSSLFTELQTLKDSIKILSNKSDLEYINEKIEKTINSILDLKEATAHTNNENRILFDTQLKDLYSLISSYIAKDETETIKNELKNIHTEVVSKEKSIQDSIRDLIPVITTLATQENLKDLDDKVSQIFNSLSNQINVKLIENETNYETKIENLNETLNNIGNLLINISKTNPTDRLENIKEQVNSMLNYVSSLSDKISDNFKETHSEVKNNLENLSLTLIEKIERLEINTQNIQDENKLETQNILELKNYSEKLITLTSTLIEEINLSIEKNTEKITNTISEHNDNLEEIKKDLSLISGTTNENILISNKINTSIEKINEDINKVNETYSTISNQLLEAKSNQKTDIEKLEDKLSLIINNTNEKVEKDNKISGSLEKIDEKINDLNEKYSSISNQLSETGLKQNSSIKDLESIIISSSTATAENNKTIDEMTTAVINLDNKIDKLNTTCDAVSTQVSDTIAGQNNFIRELETKVLLVADTTVENIKIIDEMNSSVKKLDNKIGELSNACDVVTTKLSDTTKEQTNLINDLETKFALTTNSIVEKAQNEIEEKLNIITDTCGIINSQLSEKTVSSSDDYVKNLETKSAYIANSVIENTKILNEAKEEISQINEKLVNSETEQKKSKEDILSKINEVISTLSEKLSQTFIKSEETQNTSASMSVINDNIIEKIDANSEKITKFSEEITQLLGTSLANISQKTSEENIKNDEFKEKIKIELEKTITEITNKLIKTEEETSSLKETLISSVNDAIKVIKEKETSQLETINNNFNQIGENLVKNIIEEINLDDLKIEMSQDLALYAVSLKEKISETIEIMSSNKEYLEKISSNNSTNVMDRIIEIKNDLAEIKLGNASGMVVAEIRRVGEKIEGWSNDILDTISDEIKDAFSDNIKLINETVQDNVSIIKDDLQELVIRLSDINSLTSDIKDTISNCFDSYLNDFTFKLEDKNEEIKNYISLNTEKLTAQIEEYKKEVANLSEIDFSSYSEETRQFIKDEIHGIKEEIDELKSASLQKNITTENDINLEDIIVSSTETINKKLELLRDIILSDIPSEELISENFEEIKEKVDDVKNILNKIDEQTSNSLTLQNALDEINAKTDNFANIIKYENDSLKNILTSYQSQLNEISNLEVTSVSSTDEETKEFIKEELDNLKEQILRNLTSVFENISFIEESEEIQNTILDNSDSIKNEISQLKQALDIRQEPIEMDSSDINRKFEKLKTILEGITTGNVEESEKYIYTLPDVEMDIAKMRMAINEVADSIKQNREDGYDVIDRLNAVDDIKEDISSISKRTNKLILTSDDSNKYLKENIEEFKTVLNAITKKCNKIDSSQLNQHLVDVKSLVMSGLKSDKILNEAFMHLAEWIDDSAKTMNTISSQVEVNKYTLSSMKTDLEKMDAKSEEINQVKEEIAEVKGAISELAEKLDKKTEIDYSKSLYEIEYGLDRISDKLDVQELKIKALEKKIETLSTPQDTNEETNSLLEFIASQVTAANENSRNNRLLLQKVSMLEKQMSKFENSISKITQFVDGSN